MSVIVARVAVSAIQIVSADPLDSKKAKTLQDLLRHTLGEESVLHIQFDLDRGTQTILTPLKAHCVAGPTPIRYAHCFTRSRFLDTLKGVFSCR